MIKIISRLIVEIYSVATGSAQPVGSPTQPNRSGSKYSIQPNLSTG